ncbi:MAG: PD-(D/E)XK nuclease family protein [Synergistaceae bacterium]|nr:PD-(D/E)XK nuclease family protein [Synergistaceae bacterium]
MPIVPYRKVSDLDVLLKNLLDKDLSSKKTRFIVPSRRDRDWWRLRAGLRDFGLETEEPHLWNWEDLYNDLCAFLELPPLRQIDPPDHRLILSHVVAEFLKEESSKKQGPGLLEFWPGLARPGFIDVLSDDIRELINEAVSVEQLFVTKVDGKPTSEVLPRLYERYLAYLRENRLLDSAQIPSVTLELLEEGKEIAEDWARDKIFVFVGFMSFTHGQLTCLYKLEELCREEVVVFKPATELKNFQDATRQIEGETDLGGPPLTAGKVVSLCASEHSLEPEMVARTLALWHAGREFPSSRIEIEGAREGEGKTVPDPFPGFGAIGMSVPERRLDAMEAALRRYRIPYSLARGRSIAKTLLGTTLANLWTTWSQGLDPYDTALLLAQPCLAGAGFTIDDAVRAGPRGIASWEAYLEQIERIGQAEQAEQIEKNAKNANGKKEKKKEKNAIRAFRALTKFCRTVEKGDSPAGLFGALHAFLSVPGLWMDALAGLPSNDPDLDDSMRELAASAAEVEAKYLSLRELLPDLGAAGKIAMKGKEAMDFFNSWSEDTLVQASPPIGGAVVLYAGPPPILASYPVWIMTDVTQKNWPGVIRSSPLLDVPEREAMASVSAYLPSIHDKHVQKEALFRRLLQTGDVLTLTSRSETDEEGRPLNATSFMAPFMADMQLWEHIAAPRMGIGDLMPGKEGGHFPAIEVAVSEKNQRGMPVARGGSKTDPRLPVSSLYELLDCPLRYWLKRHAKLKERDTSLFSDAEAGRLTHVIWESVWRRRQETREPLSLLIREEWEKASSPTEDYAPFQRLMKDRRLARHRQNMEFYIARLARVQQGILDRLEAGGLRHSSICAETELKPYETDGTTFTGRCDRIEVFNDDFAVIIDYKWGRSVSYEKKISDLLSRRYLSTRYEAFKYGLQLSAYALMYAAAHPEHRVVGVGFLGHKDGGLTGTFEYPVAGCYLPDKKSASIETRANEVLEALKCAAAILQSRRYEPCYLAESCRYCDVKGICRKGELHGDSLPTAEFEGESEEAY